MPAPSQQPEWSTDTNFSTGVDVGTPTKVEPSAGIKAEGHVPGTPAVAQRMNWWKNLVYQWSVWFEAERLRLASYIGGEDGLAEWVYPVVRIRAICISPLDIVSGGSKIVGGAAAGVLTQAQDLNDGWRPFEASLFGGGPGGTDTYAAADYMRTGLPQHLGYINLGPYLRTGMELKTVRVEVDPGTAQATVSDRVKCVVRKRNLTGFAASSIITSGNATATNAQQTITMSGLTEVVDLSTYGYFLDVWSSAGAAGTPDALYGVAIIVDDPGPRNY